MRSCLSSGTRSTRAANPSPAGNQVFFRRNSGISEASVMERKRLGRAPAICVEVENEWAWCGERQLDLPLRVFALLRHLVEHPKRLITKNELFAALWVTRS